MRFSDSVLTTYQEIEIHECKVTIDMKLNKGNFLFERFSLFEA